LWQRQKVQEMLRSLILSALVVSAAQAAVWPEALGQYIRQSVTPIQVQEREVWQEYGLEAAEQAEYAAPSLGSFTGSAWRLKDSTAGLAVFQWLSTAAGRTVDYATFPASETGNSTLLTVGNYVIRFDGGRPEEDVFYEFYANLPRLERAPLPVLPSYLPADGLIPDSKRYILGPAALARFVSGVPPAIAAFSLGAEAQFARYRMPSGEVRLAIFHYPTPQIARLKVEEFRGIAGAVAKRTGSFVAVALPPVDPDDAERLLAQINYQATITWNEKPPGEKEGLADLLIAIFKLIGLMIAFTVVAGFGFAALRMAKRRLLGEPESEEAMLTLHLDDR
jgi:hypothetical protein